MKKILLVVVLSLIVMSAFAQTPEEEILSYRGLSFKKWDECREEAYAAVIRDVSIMKFPSNDVAQFERYQRSLQVYGFILAAGILDEHIMQERALELTTELVERVLPILLGNVRWDWE